MIAASLAILAGALAAIAPAIVVVAASFAPPASAPPASAQPASAQPASAQPASAQPASAQPASAQPASAQPASAQPASAPQASAPSLARMSSVPIAADARIEEVLTSDFSGDDVADLCIATRATSGAAAGRARLAIHVRRSSGAAFVATADAVLDLPLDVVAFAACDVFPDAGREVLLFNASGAFAWRWREADESKRVVRLFDVDFLWQLPAGGSLFHLQDGVVDLDGDGREDVCIPEPDGARVLFQRPTAETDGVTDGGTARFGPPTRFTVPEDMFEGRGASSRAVTLRSPNGRRRLSIDLGDDFDLRGEGGPTGPYLSIDESAPHCALLDWDGDGDLDVLALSAAALHVYVQDPRGSFDPERALHILSPVPRDRSRELDVSFQVRAVDLDLDARADLVFFAQDKRADSARTQALVFRHATAPKDELPLFGQDGRPGQLLVLDGFARPIAIEDVDGDGRPDLIAAALRPNLIDALRAASSERIETELYVFLNKGAQGFSKRPDLTRVLSLQATLGEGGGSNPFLVDFAGDITGDGVHDLFVRTDRDRLRAHMVRRGRDGTLTVVDTPVWELAIDPRSRIVMPGVLMPRTPDIFVLEPGAVVCASFH